MTDKSMLWRLSGRLFLLLLLAASMRPAAGETIQLERTQHGTYTISVQINGALVLPFVLDTGASLVVIPEDVLRTLTQTGTVTKNDFIEPERQRWRTVPSTPAIATSSTRCG